MPSAPESTELNRAARLLGAARSAIALTGAGISTPSGIPDFRSPESGLWRHADPYEVASLTAFRYNPFKFFKWIHPLARLMIEAEPNPAHRALAALEDRGLLRGVITQNIDGLQQRAGSKNVLEVHGNLRTATCISCYRRYPTGSFLQDFIETGDPPRCPSCGGVLKPDAVLFGEQLPFKVMRQAEGWANEADLVVVAGSSLEVTPAALLPLRALDAGAHLIIVNQTPTYLDVRASALLRENVAVVLPALAERALAPIS
jgi:NAD-dependent deacetylase